MQIILLPPSSILRLLLTKRLREVLSGLHHIDGTTALLLLFLASWVYDVNNESSDEMTTNHKTSRTVIVGKAQDLPEGRGATVILDDGTELALFNIAGKFFAVDNSCPHRGVPLADGKICANLVECAGHGWRFDLKTGYCLDKPQARLNTYHVFIENEDIKIVI